MKKVKAVDPIQKLLGILFEKSQEFSGLGWNRAQAKLREELARFGNNMSAATDFLLEKFREIRNHVGREIGRIEATIMVADILSFDPAI